MHGISFVSRYRKYNATQRSGNTSFCNHYVRIAHSASYRIRRRNLFVEHRGNDHFHYSEQRKYIYCYSDRS